MKNVIESVSFPKLYYRYKRLSDEQIVERLSKLKLVKKENKGVGSIYGYYPLSDEAMQKILSKPRNVSLTFDAVETSSDPIVDLREYKTITYLVKSSSRFFLKPDVGEILDQLSLEDLYGNIKAICINEAHELIEDTEGEHFLMTATLLK
jgi:hypothetical protein